VKTAQIPNGAQALLDRVTGNTASDGTIEATRKAVGGFKRKKGGASPESQFVTNLLALAEGCPADLDLTVRSFDIRIEEAEGKAILSQATISDFHELIVYWAICGPSEFSKQLIATLKEAEPSRVIVACSSVVRNLVGQSPFATPGGKGFKKALGAIISSAIKVVNSAHLPIDVVLETSIALSQAYSPDVLDFYLAKTFPNTTLSRAAEFTVEPHVQALSSMLTKLKATKVKSGGARRVLLVLGAQCDPIHFESDVWENVELEQLIELKKFPGIRKWLTSESVAPLLVQRIVEAFEKSSVWVALEKASEFHEISPAEYIAKVEQKASGVSRESKMLRLIANAVAEKGYEDKFKKAHALIEQEATEEVARHIAAASDLALEVSHLKAELEETRSRLEGIRSEHRSLRDYEKSQARLDALGSLIEITERVRGWSAHDQIPGQAMREIAAIADSELSKHGVKVVGRIGEGLVGFQEFFEFADGKQYDQFVVLAPAYLLASDLASPLKKGLAQRL